MTGQEDTPFSAEVVDAITEAVVKPTDPQERATVIAALVREVEEAVQWRHERDSGSEEEQSLGELVEATAHHEARMAELDPAADDPEVDGTAKRALHPEVTP